MSKFGMGDGWPHPFVGSLASLTREVCLFFPSASSVTLFMARHETDGCHMFYDRKHPEAARARQWPYPGTKTVPSI